MELFFDNGLGNASYQSTDHSPSHTKYEKTWDTTRQIKKVSFRLCEYVHGMQFLDEKDNEIVKWDGHDSGTWTPVKEIPDGFEIIGLYGDTTKKCSGIQFGFLPQTSRLCSFWRRSGA